MNSRREIILIAGLAALIILSFSAAVFAQRPLEVDYPEIGGERPQTASFALPNYVKYVFNLSLGIAGFVVFVVLVYAGFRYLTSVGDPSRQKDAKEWILSTILGLLVLLSSYLLLATINPQLVFFDLPARIIFSPNVPTPASPQANPDILYYTEIPVGRIIEQIFLKEGLTAIENVFDDLRRRSEKVKDLSDGLKMLTNMCSCSGANSGTCGVGSCSFGSRECTSNCSCGGEVNGQHDPCSNRQAINSKRDELRNEIIVFENLRARAEREISDFRAIYSDLLSAEQLIKDCSAGIGGRPGFYRTLFRYMEFQVVRDKLKEDGQITGEQAEGTFSKYASAGIRYEAAAFYCAETSGLSAQEAQALSTAGDVDFIPEIFETGLETLKIVCGAEIPIGKTVDDAEALVDSMMTEVARIISDTFDEINTARNLADLPESCLGSNCNSSVSTSRSCCGTACAECNLAPVVPPPPPQPGCNFGCAREECVSTACTGCSCSCTGSPCPASITSSAGSIAGYSSQIVNSVQTLVDLMGRPVEDIFRALDIVQSEFSVCFNPMSSYRAIEASKSTLWKWLAGCKEVKEFSDLGMPYLSETGVEITGCYGQETDQNFLDNYFCCSQEISF